MNKQRELALYLLGRCNQAQAEAATQAILLNSFLGIGEYDPNETIEYVPSGTLFVSPTQFWVQDGLRYGRPPGGQVYRLSRFELYLACTPNKLYLFPAEHVTLIEGAEVEDLDNEEPVET